MRLSTTGIGIAAGAVVGVCSAAIGAAPPHEIWIQGWPTQVGDAFGASVAVHDGRIVVGAPAACPDFADASGRAYLFGNDGWGWSQSEELVAPAPETGRHFGCAVAVCDDCLIIGAAGAAPNQAPSGALYVYRDIADGYEPTAILVGSDSGAQDCFGQAVALDRSGRDVVAAVGAPGRDRRLPQVSGGPGVESAADVGAVYVLRFRDGTWTEEACLVPAHAQSGDAIGSVVDISGDALVTAGVDGAAFVFRFDGKGWIEEAELPIARDRTTTGRAVSIDGDRVAVGAPTETGGAVHLFAHDDRGWEDIGVIAPLIAEYLPEFGRAVALEGSTVLIGGTDRAWVYDDTGEGWGLRYRLREDELDPSYGGAVALSAGIAVVGAPYGYEFGAAYIYDIEPDADIDGDGVVGPVDLDAVASTWGPCPGCMTDVDGSGVVDVSDLLAVLAAWSMPGS